MNVAIVGLGAAGLRTAMLLEQAGAKIELFDARERLGGRIETFREGGTVYDAGAEWLDAEHVRALALCRELGLEPVPTPCWPGQVAYKGESCDERSLWYDAQSDEAALDREAKFLLQQLEDDPKVTQTLLARLDSLSVEMMIRKASKSDRGLWWLSNKYRSDEGEDLAKIGLLGWLMGYKHYLGRESGSMSAFRVPGGMGALVDAMAAKLQTKPQLRKLLVRVEQKANQATLHFSDGAVRAFDQVVLAIPPHFAAKVPFDPSLPAKKMLALENSRFGRTVKIALEFSAPWWAEIPWNGRMHTDLAIQQTWDGTLGTTPVLLCYVCGDLAEAWTKFADPVGGALKMLASRYPQASERFVRGRVHDWIGDPFSLGGFTAMGSGYYLRHFQSVWPLEGRIHFAGEHTAEWTGFVEGALESAERVATEVKMA